MRKSWKMTFGNSPITCIGITVEAPKICLTMSQASSEEETTICYDFSSSALEKKDSTNTNYFQEVICTMTFNCQIWYTCLPMATAAKALAPPLPHAAREWRETSHKPGFPSVSSFAEVQVSPSRFSESWANWISSDSFAKKILLLSWELSK